MLWQLSLWAVRKNIMSEHWLHYLLAGIPLLVVVILFFKNTSFKALKIGAFVALFSFITFQALPLHSAHAVYFSDHFSHQCCLPMAVTPVVNLEIDLPDKMIAEVYLLSATYFPVTTPFFNPGRSPPLG